jgi:hypothetical protein
VGCASNPAAPFDTLKNANATMLRLQNYAPAQQQAPAQPAAGAVPGLPGLPQNLQELAQQAAPLLQQYLPPGLLPPEMLQGAAAAAAALPQPQPQEFRFHGRQVLGTAPIVDREAQEELADLLGDEDNFQLEHQPCNLAEFGLGWSGQPGQPNYEVLISFSCNQVIAAQAFAWPHATGIGMKPETWKRLAVLISRIFPTTNQTPPPMPVSSLQGNSLALQ